MNLQILTTGHAFGNALAYFKRDWKFNGKNPANMSAGCSPLCKTCESYIWSINNDFSVSRYFSYLLMLLPSRNLSPVDPVLYIIDNKDKLSGKFSGK